MTAYRISTPVADFTGEVGNCQFVRGVYEGEVPDGPLAYFTQAGYTVEKLAAAKKADAAQAKAEQTAADPAAAPASPDQAASDAAGDQTGVTP